MIGQLTIIMNSRKLLCLSSTVDFSVNKLIFIYLDNSGIRVFIKQIILIFFNQILVKQMEKYDKTVKFHVGRKFGFSIDYEP